MAIRRPCGAGGGVEGILAELNRLNRDIGMGNILHFPFAIFGEQEESGLDFLSESLPYCSPSTFCIPDYFSVKI